jgi:hypothetical protein
VPADAKVYLSGNEHLHCLLAVVKIC